MIGNQVESSQIPTSLIQLLVKTYYRDGGGRHPSQVQSYEMINGTIWGAYLSPDGSLHVSCSPTGRIGVASVLATQPHSFDDLLPEHRILLEPLISEWLQHRMMRELSGVHRIQSKWIKP